MKRTKAMYTKKEKEQLKEWESNMMNGQWSMAEEMVKLSREIIAEEQKKKLSTQAKKQIAKTLVKQAKHIVEQDGQVKKSERKIMSTEKLVEFMKTLKTDTPCVLKYNREKPICPKCFTEVETKSDDERCPHCNAQLERTCCEDECYIVSVDNEKVSFQLPTYRNSPNSCKTDKISYLKVGDEIEIFVVNVKKPQETVEEKQDDDSTIYSPEDIPSQEVRTRLKKVSDALKQKGLSDMATRIDKLESLWDKW